ncbi:hypothetical protein HME9304_00305 [Flagellimonas maritima]|uniref:Metal-dependent hydrolase n=1 Tax=Flagellimonas maritima TaxID=1383885 RepID=A0A2Z4LPZ6_9FLAO|nr:DUF6122 family protein [Allomuricauda aurantiaca]AWX43317.1 hypothetical protein HME9304_00305 [Allomuricauda aurantiaca]
MHRFIIHYSIHFILPILIGLFIVKNNKVKVTLILLAGILIDVDHVLAEPIFDPNRCSINFHPLHSYFAILIYCILPFFKRTRIIGLALIIHIIADLTDCLLI